MFVVSEVKKKPLPFNMEDAGRAASEYEKEGAEFNKVLLDNRLDNRVLDLRVRNLVFLCHSPPSFFISRRLQTRQYSDLPMQ
jgi:hypothetical protein